MRKVEGCLPDGGIQAGSRTGRISAASSGRTLLLLTFVLFFFTFAVHAQVVDTWAFESPQQQEKALFIASQLRCPQCQNQNLLESNAPVAVSMRHQVYTMVAEGKDDAEITAWMTDRYGDFIRYNPPLTARTLLLWALPGLLLLLAGAVLWRVIRRQRREEGDQ